MAETAGVPGDAVALHAENGRLRMLLEDKGRADRGTDDTERGTGEAGRAARAADIPQLGELLDAAERR